MLGKVGLQHHLADVDEKKTWRDGEGKLAEIATDRPEDTPLERHHLKEKRDQCAQQHHNLEHGRYESANGWLQIIFFSILLFFMFSWMRPGFSWLSTHAPILCYSYVQEVLHPKPINPLCPSFAFSDLDDLSPAPNVSRT